MRNLEVYGRQCIEDLNAIGIYPNDILEFKVNTRAKKRWGQACKKSGVYSIIVEAHHAKGTVHFQQMDGTKSVAADDAALRLS